MLRPRRSAWSGVMSGANTAGSGVMSGANTAESGVMSGANTARERREERKEKE
jgi:hypothetical protein